LSLERIINTLVSLGLSRLDAEIYVYIANKDPLKAVNIANALNISKSTLYSNLKKLVVSGLVEKDNATYSALPFDEALELLIDRKKKETNNFHKSEEEFLATWKKEE
jgi:predicted transcriptional regulator